MSGFDNDIVYANNGDFSTASSPRGTLANGLITDGQLWIGRTAVNVGGTHISVGTITSPDGTLTVGYSAPNITLSVAGGGNVVEHLTADTGGQLNPTANNFNILGGPGVTTTGSGSTITINSVVFIDQGTSITLATDTGYFVTAATTQTLPAAPLQGEMVIVLCDTAGAVAVKGNTGQTIRIGNQVSSSAGTLTSTARGDSLTLRYRTATTQWMTVASMGNWTVA